MVVFIEVIVRTFLKNFFSLFAGKESNLSAQQSDSQLKNEIFPSTIKNFNRPLKSISRYRSKRARNLYDPQAIKPFKISRSKLELFFKMCTMFLSGSQIRCKPTSWISIFIK